MKHRPTLTDKLNNHYRNGNVYYKDNGIYYKNGEPVLYA